MKVLPANYMHNQAEYDRPCFFVSLPPEYSIDDVLSPKFWAHHVKKLPINSRVEVVSSDGQFDLELRVVSSDIGYVRMRVLRKWERTELPKEEAPPAVTEADIPEGYLVNHAPKTKWRVFTREPHEEIKRDLPTKEHAIAVAIEHHNKAMGIAA